MNWTETIGWTQSETPLYLMIFRLLLAAALGAAIGFEREVRHRAAGLRTHILICLAAALFTTIAFEIFHTVRQLEDRAMGDPIRAIEAVTAGVAFLGAGAIFRSSDGVRGLTTGAGMWLAAAVGVACATGYYAIALMVTTLAVIVLSVLHTFEKAVINEKAEESGEPPDMADR